MKITVVWKDPTGKWHIGECVYGPQFWTTQIEVFEVTGSWNGRLDGILWVLHHRQLREIEATGP